MKEFKSFFKTVAGNEGELCHYPTRLDPYGCGCGHDCQYCYAKSLLDFRKMWDNKHPAVADIGAIARKIKRIQPGTIVRIGGMTDGLQPIENKYKVTKETIKLLNDAGVGYLLVTKSHLIGTPEYLDILDPKLAHIQTSVTCTDDKTAITYEKASQTSRRLKALAAVQDKGIDCSLRLSPYLPELIDFAVLQPFNFKKILVEFLRINHWIEKWLTESNLADRINLTRYSLRAGGYKHLPLEAKQQEMKKIAENFPSAQISVCEDVPEHYKYWQENVNANAQDCCNLQKY